MRADWQGQLLILASGIKREGVKMELSPGSKWGAQLFQAALGPNSPRVKPSRRYHHGRRLYVKSRERQTFGVAKERYWPEGSTTSATMPDR